MSSHGGAKGTLKVSEIFDSLQGEGPSAGLPATFLRLALCNLRCAFCDTSYTWDFTRHRYDDEVRELAIESVAERVRAARGERLIITGGEPLVQAKSLVLLLGLLPESLVIEVETNGTLAPGPELLARVNQWNVSPKLENSGEAESDRIRESALLSLRDSGRAFLKLVVAGRAECDEAEALVTRLGWPRDRVLLMPLGSTRAELSQSSALISAEALARRLPYSPRLHVELWGGRRGV